MARKTQRQREEDKYQIEGDRVELIMKAIEKPKKQLFVATRYYFQGYEDEKVRMLFIYLLDPISLLNK